MRRAGLLLIATLLAITVACQPRAVLEQAHGEIVGRVQFSRHGLLFTPATGEPTLELLFDWSLQTGGVEVKIDEKLSRRFGQTLTEYRNDPTLGCLLVRGPRYVMPGFRFDRETKKANGFGYQGVHERAILVKDLQRVPCPA